MCFTGICPEPEHWTLGTYLRFTYQKDTGAVPPRYVLAPPPSGLPPGWRAELAALHAVLPAACKLAHKKGVLGGAAAQPYVLPIAEQLAAAALAQGWPIRRVEKKCAY
eukprot:4467186-Pyramimonas_sp.AAC.1